MENTTSPTDGLSEHLHQLRLRRGLTLQELAEQCGVSRATLSRIENGEVSPTAETLGRLASAFGLPISQLFAPLETGFTPLMRQADQSVWQDPGGGFIRRVISPPSGQLRGEMIEGRLRPDQRISYEGPAHPGHEHHLLLLSGALRLTVDGADYTLGPGDCLRYRLYGGSVFETGEQPAHYIIAMV